MTHGLILYGAPAVGKDTVTKAVATADSRFRLFERLKAGPGRTAGYRMTTTSQLDRLARDGEIVWENSRYGARYAIDRATLLELVHDGFIPVVHAGQPEVIAAVRDATPNLSWVVVELRCSRPVAAARIIERSTGDSPARLKAWDQTPSLDIAELSIDTGDTQPDAAAARILALFEG